MLYAFFNEHFQREFKDGIEWTRSKFSSLSCLQPFNVNGNHPSSKTTTFQVYNNEERRNTEQLEMEMVQLI